MWEYNYSNELYHYGVKGMKWGVRKVRDTVSNYRAKRKADEEAYRKKLRNINKRYSNNSDVRARARYRNQSLKGRVAGESLKAVASTVLSEVIFGNAERYKYMNQDQLKKHLTKLAVKATLKTAGNVALKDALAKSASNRYDDDGKIKKGEKRYGLMTKERKIEKAVNFGMKIAPIVGVGGLAWMKQAQAERMANEALFRKWGGQLLNESAENFIYGSYEVE